ncbi:MULTISPECIES: serpin family protein [unclassified Psychrobacter]|uniref:serpin family protein n=1 Tax=Psychrobacter TaxID=497 RepID=UPI00191A604F|nr:MULTISPECIES: serpin family protein [unclassified Psychrobacter]MDA5133399.1 serpin family protein [Psychrobacter sp. ANT_H3]|tara:strand:- start:1 stop:1365 length:1365 start_codon:yes stop_codon:yes gene_type:complete
MNNKNPIKIMTNKHIARSLALSGLLLVITGCNNSLVNTKAAQPVINIPALPDKTTGQADSKADSKDDHTAADDSASTSEGISAVVNANNQFAVTMYQQLNGQSKQVDANVFFSPYSLTSAIAMLYAAAEGNTKAQIQKTFYYPSLPILNPNSAALYNQFNKPSPNYKLNTINDLWLQQGRTPNQAYIDTVKRYYGGQVNTLDFKNNTETSRQMINEKIAKHTNQMIPELLSKESTQPSTSAILTNAVYFKADWSSRFWVSGDMPFHYFNGTSSDVDMMFQNTEFRYSEDEQVQVVELPYKGIELSMLVVLPKSKEPLAMQTLIKNLSTTQITDWTKRLKQQDILLNLPKFKIDEGYPMKAVLTDMGMPSAFGNQAKFNVFADSSPIAIDDIHHQAVIDVNEIGTEAAAATGVVAVDISGSMHPPVAFKADHPFMFMIKDNKTDAILFLGQVNKP